MNDLPVDFPENEKVWVQYFAADGAIYYITSDKHNRSTYFIYKVDGNKLVKLGEGADPIALEKRYIS